MKKEIFYHFTTRENAELIDSDGVLLKGGCGGIYVCKNIDDVLKFIRPNAPRFKFNDNGEIIGVTQTKLEELIIIEFLADSSLFEESFDHDSEHFKGAKAWVSYEDEVEIQIIKFYDVVPSNK